MAVTVRSIRRYPVKSMGGESLESVRLDARGIVGDRWYAVVDDDGKFASGKNTRRFRRRDEVFAYAASTRPDGVVEVVGERGRWDVGESALDVELTEALGVASRVLPERDVKHFDDGMISIVGAATLEAVAAEHGVDTDPRRLRVNLVLDGLDPFAEEAWAASGAELTVGSARVRAVQRIERCRTVDLAQDGVPEKSPLLKALAARDLCCGVYVDVIASGEVRVGASVWE